jgi:hypothetical protein
MWKTVPAFLLLATNAFAQTDDRAVTAGTTAAEISANYATFFDDGAIDHRGVAGAMRVHVTPRLSVGPELVYLIGPGSDRDVVLTGTLTIDFRTPRIGRAGRIEPYAVVGAGLLSHRSGNWAGVSPLVTWGGGARVWLARQIYAASDVRLGWYPHMRIAGTMGIVGR